MKRVFTRSSVIPCDLARSVLEAAGIFAVIRHELGSAAAGCSWPVPDNPALPWAWPEVWVSDEDYGRALEILAASSAQSTTPPGNEVFSNAVVPNTGMRRCRYCGTEYPPEVTVCPIDQASLDLPSASDPGRA